ncbi:uncharacterized protein JN550_002947 [Neoarthrinium moseri]|uniref:uncharacterized protein n=1 Tax=Neoarthrinium moseri TaxID=1658444 RepID=UPI001FDCFC10|nr:uncharacterized protein JN550_002947 [Neoarthrinium moseri]KAI1873678.1 hypothetical protein JN550_002947 [Neoarthrinium moseri]
MDQQQNAAATRVHGPVTEKVNVNVNVNVNANQTAATNPPRPSAEDASRPIWEYSPLESNEAILEANAEGSTEDMAPHHGRDRGASRGGQPPKRADLDLTGVLSHDQKTQLVQLLNSIMDAMHKQIKDLWDTLGDNVDDSEERVRPEGLEVRAMCWTIPNPRSAKYAAQFGNKPAGSEHTESSTPSSASTTTRPGPVPGPGVPRPGPVLGPGVPPMRMPKSPEDAAQMQGKTTKADIYKSQMVEMKRDVLANFGKWRSNFQKKLADITIKGAGNAGNVVSQVPQPAGGSAKRGGGGTQSGRGRPPQTSAAIGTSVHEFNAVSARAYPPIANTLNSGPKEKRAMILHAIMLILLGMESYTAHSRRLLCHLCSSLNIPLNVLTEDEIRVAKALSKIVEGITPAQIAARREVEGRTRRWKQPKKEAAVATAALSEVHTTALHNSTNNAASNGGLAAPLVSASLSTVFGGLGLSTTATAGLLGPTAESSVAVGTLFGLYGSRATIKMTDNYPKDIQEFALMPVHGSQQDSPMLDPKDVHPDDRRMRVTIGISGWLTDDLGEDGYKYPWQALGDQTEVYTVRWELEHLSKLGVALETVIGSAAWSLSKQEAGLSVINSLNKRIFPYSLTRASKLIDNPWIVGSVRAEKLGQVLGDAIVNKVAGERPVSLIGYGLGARAIYVALMHLAEKRCHGYVENAVLMGAPCPSMVTAWASMRGVVTGRLVNVYSKNDSLLAFGMRELNYTEGLAGLEKIVGVAGVENFDVSKIVSAHLRYQHLVGPILKKIGWEDVVSSEVVRNEASLNAMIQAENARDVLRQKQPLTRQYKEIEELEKMEGITAKTTSLTLEHIAPTTTTSSGGDTRGNRTAQSAGSKV